ncbi:MAG TPA: hypothetical protein VIW80_16860 [Pyrinomonadaceae bacterium]|jgi:hypothetical protein
MYQPHQVLPTNFKEALELGQQNEAVIENEFRYNGISIQPTDHFRKEPFDFYLPDGRSVEAKLDLRSQGTRCALLEEPTFNRAADIHIHTLTYAMVFTREQIERLYRRGKVVKSGDYQYNARAVPLYELKGQGVYLHDFIKNHCQ